MNASFFTNDQNNSISWMDSIGVAIFSKEQENTIIKFSASNWQVSVEDTVALDANTIEKITVSQGKLIILPKYPEEVEDPSPSVRVHFEELQLDFTVQYTKVVDDTRANSRVSLFWQSAGAIQSGASGVVGESRAMAFE